MRRAEGDDLEVGVTLGLTFDVVNFRWRPDIMMHPANNTA
jgi:hypothetical protein